jgi:glutathione S-transferase
VSAQAQSYMRAIMALPAWLEWRDAARREPWVLAQDEVDWPDVLRE